jgi:membrane protein DedA with SNARE-associated domain
VDATIAVHVHHALHGPKVDYISVALAALVSWIGFFGPGEAVLVAAGISASRGHVDIGSVIAVAWVGATVGGTGGWLIGRHGGRRMVLAGRWLRRRRERALERGNRFFERYGILAVYFAPSWAAGINGMSAPRFLPANAISALIWSLFIGLGSYLLGPSIRDIAGDIGIVGTIAIVVLAVLGSILSRVGLRRRRAG